MHSPFDYRRKSRLARASDLYRFLTEGKRGLGHKLINHVLVTMNHMSNDPQHGGLNQHSIDALAASLEQIAARGLEVQAAVQRVSTTDGCYQAGEPMQLTDNTCGLPVPRKEIVIDESIMCELRNLWRENIDIDRYMAICLDALRRGEKVIITHDFGPPRVVFEGKVIEWGPRERTSFIHHIATEESGQLWYYRQDEPEYQRDLESSFLPLAERPAVVLRECSREESNRNKLDLLVNLVQDLQAARERAEVKNHINVNMDFRPGKPVFDRGWVVVMLPEDRAKQLVHTPFRTNLEPILLAAEPSALAKGDVQWSNAPRLHDDWARVQIWSEREFADTVALNPAHLKLAASMGMTMLVRKIRSHDDRQSISLEVGA